MSYSENFRINNYNSIVVKFMLVLTETDIFIDAANYIY